MKSGCFFEVESSCSLSRTKLPKARTEQSTAVRLVVQAFMVVRTCMLGALQTFQKVIVGFCPAVSVVGGEDPNRFFVCLEGGVPYLLQLNEELISGKGTSVTVVNIQLKELKVRRVDKDRDRT